MFSGCAKKSSPSDSTTTTYTTPPTISLTSAQMQEALSDSTFALDYLYAHHSFTPADGTVFAKTANAADGISTSTDAATFMSSLEQAFEQQHDAHTQIIYPEPYSCFYSGILPTILSLKYAYDSSNNPYVAVALAQPGGSGNQSLGATYDNVISQLAGTVITEVNGIPISQILTQTGLSSTLADFNRVGDIGYGANADAQISEGLNSLFFRAGVLTQLPAGTNSNPSAASTFTITYETVTGNTVNSNPATVTLPWVMWSSPSCLTRSQQSGFSSKSIENSTPFNLYKGNKLQDRNYYKELTNPFLNKIVVDNKNTTSPILKSTHTSIGITNAPVYNVIQNTLQTKSFLYIYVPSFEPSDSNGTSAGTLINAVLSDLQSYINTLTLTSLTGIVVDVRDNGGGYVAYGDDLVQFLTKSSASFYPMHFRLLATQNNSTFLSYLNNHVDGGSDASFVSFMGTALGISAPYTTAAYLESIATAGTLSTTAPNVYVLTNANCFSSCDLFTARMKDSGAAIIINETGHTGGGGATVNTWSGLVADNILINSNQYFTTMPKGMDMRFAWYEMCSLTSGTPTATSTDVYPGSSTNPCRIVEGQGTVPHTIRPPSLTEMSSCTPFTGTIPDGYVQNYVNTL